ncbi:LysR family transcriptional regulator [Methylomonas sp. AM2-LC]|uniref:LysR family transcriptional regulator n=1 Tax=Methylomonas sp. AM2-LC TaxID=3153301 RepID=UPI00326744C9
MMDVKKLDWSLLRSFLAVIDCGSLLGAAKKLGTYQPTLSRQITELESQLGVPLFERTGRGLNPTVTALKIVEAAREMAVAADKIQSGLLKEQGNKLGSVRISCSEIVGSFLMPICIKKLRMVHPGIQIDLVVTNEVSNLLRREADIALRMRQPTQTSLITKHIGDIAFGVFAAPSYLERCGIPNQVDDLLKHDLLGFDKDESLIRGLQVAGISISRSDFSVRTDDQVAYINLLVEGCGIGFIPKYVAHMLNVTSVLPHLPLPTLPVWLVVHREINGNPLIRTVFDFLSDSIPIERETWE